MKWKCSACERNKDNKGKYPDCDRCVNGIITATNEDWLRTLNTEEMVDYLYSVHKGGASVERQFWIEEHKERIKMQIRGWLKQPHKEEK